MKRMLSIAVVLLLLTAMACGIAGDQTTNGEATAMIEPSPEPTPRSTPEPMPAVPDQEALLDMEIDHTGFLGAVSIRVTGMRFYKDFCVAVDYEIDNPEEIRFAFESSLESINNWVITDWYTLSATGADAEAVRIRRDGTGDIIVEGPTWQGTCYYWIDDPATKVMGIEQIDCFSVALGGYVETDDTSFTMGTREDILVNKGQAHALATPQGEILYNNTTSAATVKLSVVSLGYDESSRTLLLYLAAPGEWNWIGLTVEAVVNGIVFYGEPTLAPFPTVQLNGQQDARQAVVGLNIGSALDVLGVSEPSTLAVNAHIESFYGDLSVLDLAVSLTNPAPAYEAQTQGTILYESDEVIVRYIGLSEDTRTWYGSVDTYTSFVLEVDSKYENAALDFSLVYDASTGEQYAIVIDGETYKDYYHGGRVSPGGTTRWYGALWRRNAQGAFESPAADSLKGDATFFFYYGRPYSFEGEYPEAQLGPLTVTLS